jgi:CDP-paratose 2-epimerase
VVTTGPNLGTRARGTPRRRALVTGGAGFIGSNLSVRLARDGWSVTILDNLSRSGAERNLDWLREEVAGRLEFVPGDVRDAALVAAAVADADVVYHLAGQTAVTASVADPRGDFEANALGTLNVLEGARLAPGDPPAVLYASSNKVYGGMESVPVVEEETRFRFAALPHGVDESHPLELHSPYGCSKGVADQYVLDYARIYGVPAVVLRQSCVYGPRQLGTEEQGWVAWLVAAAACGDAITIYGTGKQVRDLLYVDDVVDAYVLAHAAIDRTAGKAYNVGGGPTRTLSVWREFQPLLERLLGRPVDAPRFADARPGDQRVFYCDTRRAARDFGWSPRVGVEEGVERLAAWIEDNAPLFARHLAR